MLTPTTSSDQLKRTHKKPYKVGKLFFGRKDTTSGAGWIVAATESLVNPIAEFEVGKQARAFCEDIRDEEKRMRNDPGHGIDINIPKNSGMTNIFDDINITTIV
jgi:hypothetical protein